MSPFRSRPFAEPLIGPPIEGIVARPEPRQDAPRGLGEFQRRSNREREYRRDGRYHHHQQHRNDDERERERDRGYRDRDSHGGNRGGRGWEATPRSERGAGARDDNPSVRVPNVGWDSTPRDRRGGGESGAGWGGARGRGWDAPTPRASRGGSPDEGEEERDGVQLDAREWEEEQIRLDRDWYMGAEEGGLMGDEEHNPLAQYEDLTALKQAEIVTKQVVRPV